MPVDQQVVCRLAAPDMAQQDLISSNDLRTDHSGPGFLLQKPQGCLVSNEIKLAFALGVWKLVFKYKECVFRCCQERNCNNFFVSQLFLTKNNSA